MRGMGSAVETCVKTSLIYLRIHVLEHFPRLAKHTYMQDTYRIYKITAMT